MLLQRGLSQILVRYRKPIAGQPVAFDSEATLATG